MLRRHLETLAGPLVVLSLAADRVDIEAKEAMGRRLHAIQHEWTPGQMPRRHAVAPADFIHSEGYVPEEWLEVDTEISTEILLNQLRQVETWSSGDLSTPTPSCFSIFSVGVKRTWTSSSSPVLPGELLRSLTTSAFWLKISPC